VLAAAVRYSENQRSQQDDQEDAEVFDLELVSGSEWEEDK